MNNGRRKYRDGDKLICLRNDHPNFTIYQIYVISYANNDPQKGFSIIKGDDGQDMQFVLDVSFKYNFFNFLDNIDFELQNYETWEDEL